MFYLLGIEENLRTLYLLSKPYAPLGTGNITPDCALKLSYINFLSNIQPNTWHPHGDNELFIFDNDVISTLVKNYIEIDFLTDFITDIKIANELSARSALTKVESAINYLCENNNDLYVLFKLVINTLFYAQSYEQGGGSISTAIGVIWCCNRKNWSLFDLTEFIVHELTHNLVFLDELRYKHYLDLASLALDENFVTSAILKKPRPLDKVFHSLLVSIEILTLRQMFLGEPVDPKVHPCSIEIYSNCLRTIEEIHILLNNRDLVSKRFKDLLSLIEKKLEQLELNIMKEKYIDRCA